MTRLPDDPKAPTHEDECQHRDEDACDVCAGMELPPLAVLLDRLRDLVTELDQVDEALNTHRHNTHDSAETLSLHAINDHASLSWGHARMTLSGLTEHLAVYPDAR